MNYQKKPPQEVIDILKKRNVQYFEIYYYAYPQIFGSTSGPCGGIGGQAMSDFTVEAWVCDDTGPTVFTCSGMYCFDDSKFEPFRKVRSWIKIRLDNG